MLKARGAVVEEFALPIMKYVVPAYYIIASAEASSNLSRFDGVKYGWRAEGYEDLTELYNKTRTQGFGPRSSGGSCWAPSCSPPATTTPTIKRPSR